MNILRIIASMDPSYGGPCQGIRNIVPVLESLGVHNEVVSVDDPAAAFLGSDKFPIHALGPGAGPWKKSDKLIPWLLDNIHRYDVVIVHGLWQYYGYAVGKVMRQLRGSKNLPRMFVMPHGMLDPYFQRAPDRKLKAVRNWLYWKLIEEKVVHTAHGVLFTCEAELLLAREPFRPYHPKNEINVGYGIQPPPAYTPDMTSAFFAKCPQVKDQSFLLFLSRIHEKKGVDLLIRAYAKVAGPQAPKLVIAGPGIETNFGQEIVALVSSLNLQDAVFFPGMVSGLSKWGAFYECEAFILPSHQENFGIAVVEALACSKPVLITRQINIWKEINAAGAGIVSEDNLEGTLELLTTWQRLPQAEKISMGTKARSAYENNFEIQSTARRFLEALIQN